MEFAASFRRLGVSGHRIRTPDKAGPLDVTWVEAVELVEACLQDTGSPLFAKVEGWAFPASMPELMQIIASAGGEHEQLMPWTIGERERREAALHVSEEEKAADLAEIMALVGK